MKCIYLQILDYKETDSSLVLATVTFTSGSTPQKPGSAALFNQTGLISGTIGGGIIEKKVQHIAHNALLSKKSGLFNFSLDKDLDLEEEAVCGGEMNILMDADPLLHKEVFEQIMQSHRDGIPGVLITCITKKNDHVVGINRLWDTGNGIKKESFSPEVQSEIKKLLSGLKINACLEFYPTGEQRNILFILELLLPLPKLIIAGAGHIGKALAHLGKLIDFEVTVIDDRIEFANATQISDADYFVVNEVGQAIEQLKMTKDTYIAIVTRGHKGDTEALKHALGSEAAYIGMIGSAKKIALIRKKSLDEGWATSQQWTKIHAPIGLPIQSESVQEIAISIAAQLIKERNSNLMQNV